MEGRTRDDNTIRHAPSRRLPRLIRHRPALLPALLLALALVGFGTFGLRLNLPTRTIARPGADANPSAVVRAYLDAYDARDLATLSAICPAARSFTSRFRAMGRFTDPDLGEARYDDGSALLGPAGTDPARGRVYVPVRMTAHGMIDQGFTDGPIFWGFFLERDTRSEPWVIVDQGVP